MSAVIEKGGGGSKMRTRAEKGGKGGKAHADIG